MSQVCIYYQNLWNNTRWVFKTQFKFEAMNSRYDFPPCYDQYTPHCFNTYSPWLAIYIVHETDAKLISDWEQNTLYTWPLANLRLYPDHKVSNAFGKANPKNSYLPNDLPCESRKFTKFLTHTLIMYSIIISIYINDRMNVRLTNKNI